MEAAMIERVEAFLHHMGDELDIERAYVFGSRAREDYGDWSDVDLIIVSSDFEGVPTYLRAKPF